MKAPVGQILKCSIAAAFGAAPGIGLGWAFDYPIAAVVVLSILGAFVCAALTFPGVSAARVFGKTAEMIVTHNTCPQLGEALYKGITGEEEETPVAPPAPIRPPPDFSFLKDATPADSDSLNVSKESQTHTLPE
jgi:hypothetical protein